MYPIHRIEELGHAREDSRRAIAALALSEGAHLADLSIDDVAQATFTSKATVTRFAKALGYTGWRDFIRDFMREVAYEGAHAADVDVNFPFKEDDTDMLVAEQLGNLMAETAAATLKSLDRGMLAMAVRHLERAKAVWVFSRSPNHYLAQLFCRKLISIGKPATAVRADENGIVARSLGPDDCAIVISYSGDNPEANPMAQIELLRQSRVHLIALTSGGNNYLRQMVPCVLTIDSRERLYTKITNFSTEESVGYLLNILFACYFKRSYQENLDFRLRSSQSLELERKTALRELRG